MRPRIEPLITVVTPSFNQGEYIEDTIRSVLEQDYPYVQHLIMDGGSTDSTVEVLKRYGAEAEIVVEKDGGQVDAITKGFSMANGEIVTWLNSDDVYVHKDTLSNVVGFFAKNPQASVISGSTVLIDSDDNLLQVYRAFPRFSLRQLMLYDYIRQPATFFRAEVLRTHSLDKTLDCAFDYDFWLKLSEGFRFLMVRDIFAGIRRHGDMKTIRLAQAMADESDRVVARYRDRIHVAAIDKLQAPFLRAANKIAGLALIAGIYLHREHDYAVPIKLNSFTRTCLRQVLNHRGVLF